MCVLVECSVGIFEGSFWKSCGMHMYDFMRVLSAFC